MPVFDFFGRLANQKINIHMCESNQISLEDSVA